MPTANPQVRLREALGGRRLETICSTARIHEAGIGVGTVIVEGADMADTDNQPGKKPARYLGLYIAVAFIVAIVIVVASIHHMGTP